MSDNEKVLPNTPSEHAICSRECGLHRELGSSYNKTSKGGYKICEI